MALRVYRSERADRLVEALGDLLLAPPDDPMSKEIVAVPTRGVERWLSQRLSHRLGTSAQREDGVCANVEFPFPGTLIGGATAVACGFDPENDPWPPERSVWPLLGLVDAFLNEPFLAPLAAHLRAASPLAPDATGVPRRFSAIRHLADLYDRYAVHRPDLVLAWARGQTSWPGADDPDRAWQAELWCRLRERIGLPSPAERYATAATRLASEPDLVDLPGRLSVFGLTRFPASHLRVLQGIAAWRDVCLFLLHPSGALWEKVARAPLVASGAGRASPEPTAGLRRADDATAALPAHPLLRSWGRDAREMQLVLSAHGLVGGEHRPVPAEGSTLLGLIQADIRADRQPRPGPERAGGGGEARPLLASDDDSLRIHACHGRARQVEVMRDAVLHLLAADPTLEPRDVIVMCPDIESFAPLVHAAFGAGEADSPDPGRLAGTGLPRLRARLADRSLRQTNPLLAVAAHVLELAGGRVTASDVLDLASREPVSRRFQFDDEDLSRIGRWVAGTGARWGLDAAHRARWGLGDLEANTWAAGLDRLMLGVAMTEAGQRLFGGALPFEDVSSATAELAGRLAELVDRLGTALDELAGAQPVGRWVAALARATESLAQASPADSWQHGQLHGVLEEVVQEAAGNGPAGSPMDLAEVTSLLGQRLQGRPTRANFRTGDMTICTLVPMRSVPHRVVGLLGLDDGVFPRHGERDGDDLLLAEPCLGDGDARSEDRQLLLDALLAATEHLVITYGGRDQRTNQELPPAVPIAELLDVVDRTVRVGPHHRRPRDDVVVHHPLQSFDPRNFSPASLGTDQPWSFDPVNLEGARSFTTTGPRRGPRGFLSGRLGPAHSDAVSLQSLVRFVEHPVKAFLRERLMLYADGGSDQLCDALPVELGPLEKWEVGDRLLEARLGGATAEEALAAERGRGLLPPGPLADALLGEIGSVVDALVDTVDALPCAKARPESVEVNVALPDGRSLVGTVPGVRDGTILRCTYSRLKAKQRLAAWARFLALRAARPDLGVSAVTVGRGEGSSRRGAPPILVAALVDADSDAEVLTAQGALQALVDLYDRGMREPLPLYCETSAAWARAVRSGTDAALDARSTWEPSFGGFTGEAGDPEHVLVLGPDARLEDLLSEVPAQDEAGEGWAGEEATRLGRLARRLWDNLLDHEQTERR